MAVFDRRRVSISLTVAIFLLISLLVYARSVDDEVKLRITLVDYRWQPILNLPVRLESTGDQLTREYLTNTQGQLVIDLKGSRDQIDYIRLLADGIDERILPRGDELILRLPTVHQNTGEMYDDFERFT